MTSAFPDGLRSLTRASDARTGRASSSDPTGANQDYWMVPAEPGDRILVCSDGLSGELSAQRLRTILAEESDPQDAATRLIHEALVSGGRDNVTAIVVDARAVTGHDDLFDTAPAGARRHADEDTRPRDGSRGDL